MDNAKSMDTSMSTSCYLDKDDKGKEVNMKKYRDISNYLRQAAKPRLGARHPTPSVRGAAPQNSKQSSSSTPRRPAPTPSVEIPPSSSKPRISTQDRKAHQQTQRLGARYPTPKRGKLMTATEAAVSHA
ncbi:hypothetical protein PIB30_099758 [Stylosanthes scabra]|uniref:Uncharacterized protein n=1 Tax=Stylosanthes scabra TaxID=79078 RepID=A0ABU6YZW2_9FABA|nr:hypothetical protein [Stylosanthes scabra]